MALGLQIGWGGAYMDSDQQAARFQAICEEMEELLRTVAESDWAPPTGWRLVIADSEWVEEKLIGSISPEQATHDKIGSWWDATRSIGIDPLGAARAWAQSVAASPHAG